MFATRAVLCLAFATLVALRAEAAVEGRYVYLGNALSEKMELAEVQVFSGGDNVILKRPEVFTQGLEYSWYMHKREPDRIEADATKLVDGKLDPTQRVSFGSKIGGGYLDIALRYSSLELDLGRQMPIDKIAFLRSRYTDKLYQDLGWRILVVLDENRRIVASEAFNVYGPGWKTNEGIYAFEPKPASGPWAGRTIAKGKRCWLSEAEYIRDFLDKPVVNLARQMTAEDKARLAEFQRRNEPEEIAKLGKRFFRLVDLDSPGLAAVKTLVGQGGYAAALEAFKEPFINRLEPLEDWNAGEGTSIYTHYAWVIEPDTRATGRARDLRNGFFGDREELVVKRFQPGLLPPARLEFPFQMRPLLLNYVVSGDAADLRLWEAMTDDWAMGFQDAADKEPQKLRNYFVLLQALMGNLKDLRMAAKSRPAFVRDLSGATLARLMMPILEEIPVASWRVNRTCTFNHTFNGVPEGLFVAQMLDQFYAGQRWLREMQQAFDRLYTLNMYRDGPMAEIGDEGHYLATIITPANLYGYYVNRERPDWFTPERETYFLDHYRANVLSHVRNVSPCGAHVRWNNSEDGPYFIEYELGIKDPYWRNVTDMRMNWGDYFTKLTVPLLNEPEPRAIVDTVYGRGRPEPQDHRKKRDREAIVDAYGGQYEGRPSFLSDWLPYAGLWYFRGGWDHEAAFLHMIKPAIATNIAKGRDQLTQHYTYLSDYLSTTSYRFYDYATPLLTGVGVSIDEQPPCPEEDLVPCGSKQGNFNRAVEKPQPSRWYTDAQMDFGEAIYRGNYRIARIEFDHKTREYYFRLSPHPVNDVVTTRQIFQVRPERLFLQVDRLRYATADETHTNTLKNIMIVPTSADGEPAPADRVKILSDPKRVEMHPPDNAGVTVAWFGQDALDVTLDSRRPAGPKFGGPSITLAGYRQTQGQDVLASWKATGRSVLVSLLRSTRPGEEPIAKMVDLSTADVAGLRAEMADGATVSLVVARQAPAELTLGPASVDGEALLLIEKEGAEPGGLALGVEAFRLAGREQPLPGPNFRFTLSDGALRVPVRDNGTKALVHLPVDPPTIGPEATTFADSATVTLSSATPGVDIYYTTDRSDPTVESTRYDGPFRITKDTFIKARAFRKGVTRVPFVGCGDQVSAVSYGFFRKQPLKQALSEVPANLRAGLKYDYLEDRWFALWTYTDQLEAKASGTTPSLLDVSMRRTDGPFAVRYSGYIDIPADGVYRFHAPPEYVDHTSAPGYDLRVYIDDQQWDLGQTWHGRGIWSVPLARGLHRFRVTFADARAKDLENQRVDLAFHYPYARTTWKGVAPVLEVSGPGIDRRPLPNAWLKH